jgi:RNA polymerase sigma factor (sigma-70 family)
MSNENTSTRTKLFDLFVSYCHQDTNKVTPIIEALKRTDLRVFDPLANPEEMWGRDLNTWFSETFLSKAKAAMVFLSKEYANSKWCNTELNQIIRLARENPGLTKILPVRLDESRIPTEANDIVFIDLASQTPEQIASLTKEKLAEFEEGSEGNLVILTDEELVKRIAEERDSRAFEHLYKRIYPMLVCSIQSYFESHDERVSDDTVDGIVSDIAIKLWEQAAKFHRQESSFDMWLRYLTRQCIVDADRMATRDRAPEIGNLFEPPDSAISKSPGYDPQKVFHDALVLQEVFKGLDQSDQALLKLMFSGMTHREISDVLGITDAAVRKRLHRVMNRIRNRVVHLENS